MGESTLKNNLELVSQLRKSNINTEIYLDESKVQKQLKYAYNKGIRFVIIA
jgi:histidyl-tRNA synthetase